MSLQADRQLIEEFNSGALDQVQTKEPENFVDVITPDTVKSPRVNVEKTPRVQEVIDQGKTEQKMMSQAVGAKKKAAKVMGAAVPSIDELPVPNKGIGLLVFLALLMVFAITQAPGQTVSRLQLVWGSIMGNYSISASGKSGTVGTSTPVTAPVSAIPLNYIQGGVSL